MIIITVDDDINQKAAEQLAQQSNPIQSEKIMYTLTLILPALLIPISPFGRDPCGESKNR